MKEMMFFFLRTFICLNYGRLIPHMGQSDDNAPQILSQYLQPRLRRFQLFGGPITDDFLMQISKYCPNLSTFLLDNPRDKITAQGLLNFLNATPSIIDFCSWSGLELAIDERVWLHFANRPSLQKLSLLSPQLTRSLAFQMTHAQHEPFQSLTSFHCIGMNQGIVPLLPYLSRLQDVDLRLNDATTDILSSLAVRCPSLQSLKIEYAPGSRCEVSELISVADGCKALQILEIEGAVGVDTFVYDGPKLSDIDIARFSKGLPSLKTCRLELATDASHESLRHLGQYCPALETVLLHGSFELISLTPTGDEKPLFPNLKTLKLHSLRDFTERAIQSNANVLCFHMPMLLEFDSGAGSLELDRKVLWRSRWQRAED